MGIALAKMLKNTNKEVTVWSALPDEIEKLKKTSRHPKLPNVSLPLGIEYTTDIKSAIENKDIIMFAVPSVFVRQTAKKCKPYIKDNQIIVDVAKGIEPDTLMTLTEVINDEIKNPTVKYVALSGPTHVKKLALICRLLLYPLARILKSQRLFNAFSQVLLCEFILIRISKELRFAEQ